MTQRPPQASTLPGCLVLPTALVLTLVAAAVVWASWWGAAVDETAVCADLRPAAGRYEVTGARTEPFPVRTTCTWADGSTQTRTDALATWLPVVLLVVAGGLVAASRAVLRRGIDDDLGPQTGAPGRGGA